MKLIAFDRVPHGAVLHTDEGTHLRLEAWRDNIIRLSYTGRDFADKLEDIVVAKADDIPVTLTEEEALITLAAPGVAVEVRRATFAIRFLRGGRELCRLSPFGMQLKDTTVTVPHYESDPETEDRLRHVNTEEIPGYRFYLSFDLPKEEPIYGLGQYGLGTLDRREAPVYLYQMNNFAPVPFFVSPKGWGALVDSGSFGSFTRDIFGTTYYADSVNMGDWYFVAGDKIDDAIAGYRTLTGAVPMMPKWLFGYTQCKEHYHTQEELLNVLREYRRRRVPLDHIVQDWNYWPDGTWSDKSFDLSRYPDPTAMCDEIHRSHAHIMISVWPNTRGGDSFRELFQKNQLLTDDGTFGGGGCYNVFDEGACETYWRQLDRIRLHGFDAWWCDASEPFEPSYGGYIPADEHKDIALREYKKWFDSRRINVYSLLHCRSVYTRQRRASEQKRVVNLTRSGYAGQQRYSGIVWSGDIGGSWDEMRKQIAEGLNFCASGLPYWTLDIGGFWAAHGGGTFNSDIPYRSMQDPGYRELYTRWLQFGCFLPVFRSHGTQFPREIWQFGEEGTPFYEAIRKFIELRYTLLPYIYSTAWQVSKNSQTFIRLLAYDFPEDKKALKETSTYLFGKSILVSPVDRPQYYEGADVPLKGPRSKAVYLPAGADWYDFWTGEKFSGGRTVTVDTPIDSMPLFVKAGSVLPTAPVMQYVDEIPDAPYTLTVYPGADASFTLYEDAGDGYDYEKGAYAEYDLNWNDAASTLTVSPRRGSFPGMQESRELKVRLVNGKEHTVTYTGKAIAVNL